MGRRTLWKCWHKILKTGEFSFYLCLLQLPACFAASSKEIVAKKGISSKCLLVHWWAQNGSSNAGNQRHCATPLWLPSLALPPWFVPRRKPCLEGPLCWPSPHVEVPGDPVPFMQRQNPMDTIAARHTPLSLLIRPFVEADGWTQALCSITVGSIPYQLRDQSWSPNLSVLPRDFFLISGMQWPTR